jgi:hypothetical protein
MNFLLKPSSSFDGFLLYYPYWMLGKTASCHEQLLKNLWGSQMALGSMFGVISHYLKVRTIFRSVSGLLELGKCFHRRKQLLSFSTRTEIIGTDLIFKILQEIFISFNLFLNKFFQFNKTSMLTCSQTVPYIRFILRRC